MAEWGSGGNVRGPTRRRAALLALGVAAAAVTGCLVPPSSRATVQAYPGHNLPDPTMVREVGQGPSTGTEVFSTTAEGMRVPSYSIGDPPTAPSHGPIREALATWPATPYRTVGIWAPSVMYVHDRYLMMYSEYFNTPARANCIGEATSSNGYSFTPSRFYLCSPDHTHGYLDPSLFIDRDGTISFAFSEQWDNCGGAAGGGSQLWIWHLNATGTGLVGSPTPLLTWGQARRIRNLPGQLGGTPCLENPQLDLDPHNGYDLLFSIGTFSSNATYVTGEVACGALNDSSHGCGLDPSGGGVLLNPGGGASTETTGYPDGNSLIWEKWVGTNREDFFGPTSS